MTLGTAFWYERDIFLQERELSDLQNGGGGLFCCIAGGAVFAQTITLRGRAEELWPGNFAATRATKVRIIPP